MTIYTLYDGSEVKLPDGLSRDEAENLIAKALPAKAYGAGRTYDITKEYDLESGVSNADLRLSLSLAQSPEEKRQVLNKMAGKDGWGVSEFGQMYLTPTGIRRLGDEPKDNRKVVVDAVANNLYDIVDLVPEITTGIAAAGAELLLPMFPGSGALGVKAATGFLSLFTARQLAARSLAAGAGDFAANMGLEGIQSLRGNQLESADEILTRAGSQGAAVAGLSFALGLPFAAVGPLAGKLTDVAKNRIKNVTTDNDIAVSATSALKARQEAKEALKKSGKYTDDEIEKILPVVTLKHQLGDEGNLASKYASVLEGMGAKQLGDKIPAQALQALQALDDIWAAGTAKGLPTHEIAAMVKNSLSAKDLQFFKQSQEKLSQFYKQQGVTSRVARDRSQLQDLLLANVEVQLKHGMRQFAGPSLYGSPKLQLDNLAAKSVDNPTVANVVNNIARRLNASNPDADEALRVIASSSGELVGKLTNAIEIKQTPRGSVAVAKTTKETLDEVKKFPGMENFAQQAAQFSNRNAAKATEDVVKVSARDLYEIDKSFRNKVATDSGISRNEIRQGMLASEEIVKTLDDVVGPTFSKELKRVNGLYKKFITPFNKGLGKYQSSTTKTVPKYVQDLIKNNDARLFPELVRDLDNILSGIPEAGGRGKGVLTADQFLGEVAIQFMRGQRDKFGLLSKDLVELPMSELRKNANKALKELKDLKEVESNPDFVKAFNRFMNNQAFKEYTTALRQLASGNMKGANKLKTQLSFNEAAKFIDNVATLGNNLSGDTARLASSVETFKQLKQLDPRAAKFYNELLYSQIFERVLKIGGADASARNTGIKAWADDIVKANQVNPEGLKELLGEYHKPITNMGYYMQGALNIDPTAGAISAAGQPLMSVRGLLNASLSAAVKPIVFLKVMKEFAPGGKNWTETLRLTKKGLDTEEITKKMDPEVKKAIKKAERAAALSVAGRDGLFAASISGYLNEADDRLPPANTPIPKVIERTPEQAAFEKQQGQQQAAAPAPDLAMQQQELGASIMNMLQSASKLPPMGNIGESGLKEGAAIARAR